MLVYIRGAHGCAFAVNSLIFYIYIYSVQYGAIVCENGSIHTLIKNDPSIHSFDGFRSYFRTLFWNGKHVCSFVLFFSPTRKLKRKHECCTF